MFGLFKGKEDQGGTGSSTSNHVYVQSQDHAWVPARLLETNGDEAKVSLPNYKDEQSMQSDGGRGARGSTQITVSLKAYPAQALPLQNVNEDGTLKEHEDMVDLPFLHEAAILYNLKSRHVKSRPYTRTGDIVIAVNPYKWVNELYTEKRRNYYSQELVWKKTDQDARKGIEPHVYEVSALAYRGLALDQQNQSILVSGESGAGKTETVKIAMNHIASVQRGILTDDESKSSFVSPIVQRVLDSNPLLEAFGNAKTTRNDNSSRFGKYIQLQFDGQDAVEASYQGKNVPDCKLAGSKCEVYLLEKSRVVGHDEAERTYHIFYQLLAAPEDMKAKIWEGLKGTDNESFHYVGYTDTNTIEGKTDGEHFLKTVESLELIGVKDEKFYDLMRTICVVMQLGNIAFDPHPNDSEKTVIATMDEFAMLAELMGLPANDLVKAFTERLVTARGETFKATVTAEKARDACDAFAKEIYARAFLWLVREINDATCAEKNYSGGRTEDFGLIGLLDIFGFEHFKINRFEQLCINYANEKLQQKFTEDIFRTVQEEYESEGIELDEITYDDNTDVLDLIEARHGLLAMLNEECFRPKGNDKDFVSKATQANKASPCLIKENIMDSLEFGIQHYAARVVYHADSFVAKNTDNIPSDLKDVSEQSCLTIISKHLRNDDMMNSDRPHRRSPARRPVRGAPQKKNSNLVGETVWTKFKNQLGSLMETLSTTRTRYIRCIKPNTKKKPLIMEHQSTVEQLRCAGVVAAVTISRSAFPNRLDHQVVLDRFKSLWPKGGQKSEAEYFEDRAIDDVETLLSAALKELEVKTDKKVQKAFVIGNTRAYFRAGALEYLESKRLDGMGFWAAEIQRIARGRQQRLKYVAMRKAAILIQKDVRRFVILEKFQLMKRRAIQIQCWARCVSAKKLVAEKRIFYNATKIQIRWKILKAVASFKKHKAAAIEIQRIMRGAIQRPKFRQALQDKRDEADMQKKLAKMRQELEDAENRQKMELEKERERALRELEEERAKMRRELEAEREHQREEAERIRLEGELQRQAAAMEAMEARAAAAAAASAAVQASTPPMAPSPPPIADPGSPPPSAEQIRIVEKIKYIEEKKEENSILTEQQQALMEESGKIIEFLRAENMKLRKKNDQLKKDNVYLKDNNSRLMEANASAGASFQALNQHAKQLNGTNQKLLKTVAQYKNKITQLHGEMKSRQRYYKEIGRAYQEESDARTFYERTMLNVVDFVRGKDQDISRFVMLKAAECAKVSQAIAGAAPAMDESETSSA